MNAITNPTKPAAKYSDPNSKALQSQVLVPMLPKLLVLVVEAEVLLEEAAFDAAAPLFDTEVSVAKIECFEGLCVDLEAHSGSHIRSPFRLPKQ